VKGKYSRALLSTAMTVGSCDRVGKVMVGLLCYGKR
jgi:hypothetical protein